MPSKGELQCCLGCGRDAYAPYCRRCIGREGTGGKGYRTPPVVDLPLEDDYSEESNADSVCDDNSASRGWE